VIETNFNSGAMTLNTESTSQRSI